MANQATSRRQLYRWSGWFFVANTFLYFLIGLNYLLYLPDFNTIPLMTRAGVILGWVFMLTGLLGQLALVAFFVLHPRSPYHFMHSSPGRCLWGRCINGCRRGAFF